ncbi:MAG: hypothetical protein AAB529_02835 [Patescibacteria group bacterium]
MKNQKIIVSLFFVSLLSFPLISVAASLDPSLITALNGVVSILTLIVSFICTIMIIVGGIMILSASGDADKVKTGRQTILYAVVGFVIVLIANGIMLTVKSIAP